MHTECRVGFSADELEVYLRVHPEQGIMVNGVETALVNLRKAVERAMASKHARIHVDVLPPHEAAGKFLDLVRQVKKQLRPLNALIAFRTVRSY